MVSRSSAGLHVQKPLQGEGEDGRTLTFACGAARAALRAADVTSGFEITSNAAFSVVRDFEPARHVQRRPLAGARAAPQWRVPPLLPPPVRDRRKAPQIANHPDALPALLDYTCAAPTEKPRMRY